MRKAAFFLDRDGTINFDFEYLNDPDLVELIPGSAQAIRRINEAGHKVIVVTNQSGVGRGIIKPENLVKIHKRLDELLAGHGARIDYYQICLHVPDDHCDCRKPKPKMVLDMVKQLNLDPAECVFIGDMLTDLAMGKNSGCGRTVLVRTSKASIRDKVMDEVRKLPKEMAPDFVANDLAQAVEWALPSLSE